MYVYGNDVQWLVRQKSVPNAQQSALLSFWRRMKRDQLVCSVHQRRGHLWRVILDTRVEPRRLQPEISDFISTQHDGYFQFLYVIHS